MSLGSEWAGTSGLAAWQDAVWKLIGCSMLVLSPGCRHRHVVAATPRVTHREAVTHRWGGIRVSCDTCQKARANTQQQRATYVGTRGHTHGHGDTPSHTNLDTPGDGGVCSTKITVFLDECPRARR